MNWLREFDIRTGTWRKLANMNFARSHHASVEYKGSLYVSGGLMGKLNERRERAERSTERYDRANNKWTICADMVMLGP